MIIDLLKHYEIVLASQSPRRKELLERMDIPFTTISVAIDESIEENSDPIEAAVQLSKQKALAVPESLCSANTIVITADTVVAVEGSILGKPTNADEACKMLLSLSGAEHDVITGVSIRLRKRIESFHAISRVGFSKLSKEEIEYYIDRYRPFDKAGSYGIQEWIGIIGIDHLEGSYFNVMGLPTQKLYHALGDFLDPK